MEENEPTAGFRDQDFSPHASRFTTNSSSLKADQKREVSEVRRPRLTRLSLQMLPLLGQMLTLALATSIGSTGTLKYTNVTRTKLKKAYWSVSTTCPKFRGVSVVVQLANKSLASWCANEMKLWTTKIVDGMDKPEHAWDGEYTPTVALAEPNLISVEMTEYADMEGAHPNTAQHELNFGLVKGVAKRLVLSDLFLPGTNPLPVVSALVIAKLKAKDASWVVDGTHQALTKPEGDQFLIKRDRLTFVFSPYEMGSYAEGAYEIDVPFKALLGKLNPAGPLKSLLR